MTWNRSMIARSRRSRSRSSVAAKCITPFGLPMFLLLILIAPAFATDDDVETIDVAAVPPPAARIRLIQRQVDNNRLVELEAVQVVLANRNRDILETFGIDQRQRWKLNTESDLAIGYLDRICQLTDQQREKLTLAGRADRQRFFDRYRIVAANWQGQNNQTPETRDELSILQNKFSTGLLDGESFFAKSLGHVLTADQLAHLETHRRETHLALANKVLDGLTSTERLDESQRDALRQLMMITTPVPLDFGNTDELLQNRTERSSLDDLFPSHHLNLMRYQLALKSMERVKPLLRPIQWQEIRPQLIEYRRFEQNLLALKLISPLDEAFQRVVPIPEEPK